MMQHISGRHGCILRLGIVEILHDHVDGSIFVSFPWTHRCWCVWRGFMR